MFPDPDAPHRLTRMFRRCLRYALGMVVVRHHSNPSDDPVDIDCGVEAVFHGLHILVFLIELLVQR